jgi:hypothetical protein
MRRFSLLFILVTAALTCGGLFAGATAAAGATTAAVAIGSWGTAVEAPGTVALNVDKTAATTVVSCTTSDCVAGGTYIDASENTQAFITQETDGTWATAQALPDFTKLNYYQSVFSSLSCPSAGNCVAGGYYTDSSEENHQAWLDTETDGTWAAAEEAPGTSVLNTGGSAEVTSVSCPSAGNCVAAGYYTASGQQQVFAATETSGSWSAAKEIAGAAGFNAGGSATVTSVSCGSAGNCAVGGSYRDSAGDSQAFIVNETGGVWGTAEELPGTSKLNTGGDATVTSVSCAAAGDCTAGGSYRTATATDPFVLTETGNAWGTAEEAPGTAGLNTGDSAAISSVSCAVAGNCTVGGYYSTPTSTQAFVLNEANGGWGTAEEVPGTSGLNTGSAAQVNSVSCSSAGNCALGGQYRDLSTASQQAFVDHTTAAPISTSTALALSTATVTYGDEQAVKLSATVTASSGTPAGTVSVKSGSATVCTMTLSGGKGSCTPGSTTMGTGTQHLVAVYNPSSGFASSTSAAKTVTVGKASTKSALKLSAGTITYGKEQSEHLSVTISPRYSGTPTGKVTVKKGSSTVCTITLKGGKGSCTLSSKQFGAGTYTLVAAYQGSGDYNASTSGKETLKVVK